MREKLCSGDYDQLFKLHKQKMMTMTTLSYGNHQEILTSHQTSVLLSVFSNQSPETTVRCLEAWGNICDKDCLHESRKSFDDISRSFVNGLPRFREEFFDENNCVRKEWISWIYNKL